MRLDKELKDFKEDKDMNISELGFEDERQSEISIDAEQAIRQFTYHHVPRKSDGLIKQEQALMGARHKKEGKEKERILQPLVIELDEDELIQDEPARRSNEARAVKRSNEGPKRGGQLRIESDDMPELEVIEVPSRRSEDELNFWSRPEEQ